MHNPIALYINGSLEMSNTNALAQTHIGCHSVKAYLVISCLLHNYFCLFVLWCWGSNPGFCPCQTRRSTTELQPQWPFFTTLMIHNWLDNYFLMSPCLSQGPEDMIQPSSPPLYYTLTVRILGSKTLHPSS